MRSLRARFGLLVDRVERLMSIPADGADHGADVGAGSGRGAADFVDQESHQLLRAVRR